MLKSLRNLPAKSVLSVIQSQNAYCSSNSDERVNKLLRTRSAQKQMYGSVIETNRKGNVSTGANSIEDTPNVEQLDISNDKKVEMKVAARDRASEFYWLFQRGSETAKNIKVLRFNRAPAENDAPIKNPTVASPPTNTSPNSTNWNGNNRSTSNDHYSLGQQTSQTTVISAKNAIISAKNLIHELMASKKVTSQKPIGQEIPFDSAALNSILSYPLIGDKGTLVQTEDLLADRSLRLPSISKVLQATMPESSRIALRKWKLGKIAELGLDGFKQYEKETLNRGKEFHSAIEHFLSQGTIPQPDSSIIKLWDSIDNSLQEMQPKPILLEQPILHADLKYKGIIDNVSVVRDQLCAFEWKTSEKAKPRLTSTYDAPVQLCAYLGALNVDPRYDLTVKNGCVVVAYKNGDAANVFNLTEADLRKYWLVWLQRLQEYWIRVRDGTLPDPI